MKKEWYGNINQTILSDEVESYVEDVRIKGFTVLEGIVAESELTVIRELIDEVYSIQVAEFGLEKLKAIDEEDICRFCLKYNEKFISVASNTKVLQVVRRLLGDFHILNLQNAILNRPSKKHRQSAWHRDLPYLNSICSGSLAVSALFAIDDFSELSGGTVVLPYSHKLRELPSNEYIEKQQLSIEIKAGCVVLFDAMLFHRAGDNNSSSVRRALNHMYTIPIIKQQYDISSVLKENKITDSRTRMLLGGTSIVPADDVAWRNAKLEKIGK